MVSFVARRSAQRRTPKPKRPYGCNPLTEFWWAVASFVLGDSGFARPSGLPSLPYEPEKMVSFVARRAAHRRIPKSKKRYGCNPLAEFRWAVASFFLGDSGLARPSGLPLLPYEPEKMVSFVARRAAQKRIPKPKKRYGCNHLTESEWVAASFVLGESGLVEGLSGGRGCGLRGGRGYGVGYWGGGRVKLLRYAATQ